MKFNYKFNLIFTIIFLLSLFYVNATLVDSEDFESYTPNVAFINTINESNGKWNCTSPSQYPSCVGILGSGDGTAYVQIQEESSNFLRVHSINGSWDDWRSIDISHYPNNSTGGVYNNFSISFDLKVFNFECGTLSNTAGSYWRFKHFPNNLVSGTANYMDMGLGGQWNLSVSDNLKMRPYRNSLFMYPFDVDTDVSDYQWHSITIHYLFNGTEYLYGIDQYLDGNLMDELRSGDGIGSPYSSIVAPFFSDMLMESRRCFDVGIDNIETYENELITPTTLPSEEGEIFNCSLTQCSTWSKPFFLYEEFNGSINDCGWATLENVCFNYELERELSDSYYSAFKEIDSLTEINSRYATASFDLKPISVNSNGYIGFSVYDEDYTRYIQFFLSDDTKFYNNDGGSVELVYSNVTNNTYKTVELHIDFTNNDFDLWYDDVKVATSLGLSVNFFDATNIGGIRISSSGINYKIDDVSVFSSDQNNALLPVDIEIVQPISTEKSMCGLFYKTDVECSLDSDCVTDDCKPDGKCNHFDMTYCDENGYARGNKCFVSAVTYCTLNSTQEIILDNFLLFLVFIIIIIGIVYIIFLVKG